jgi:hypothetical protein
MYLCMYVSQPPLLRTCPGIISEIVGSPTCQYSGRLPAGRPKFSIRGESPLQIPAHLRSHLLLRSGYPMVKQPVHKVHHLFRTLGALSLNLCLGAGETFVLPLTFQDMACVSAPYLQVLVIYRYNHSEPSWHWFMPPRSPWTILWMQHFDPDRFTVPSTPWLYSLLRGLWNSITYSRLIIFSCHTSRTSITDPVSSVLSRSLQQLPVGMFDIETVRVNGVSRR